mgnify:FL=1|jgi:hypothetical protein
MTYRSNRIVAQRDLIRDDLIAGKTITPMDALEKYGCYRLAARIGELRKEGMNIETKQYANDNMYAHYSLVAGE